MRHYKNADVNLGKLGRPKQIFCVPYIAVRHLSGVAYRYAFATCKVFVVDGRNCDEILASASMAFRQLLLGLVICVAPLFNQSNILASTSTAFRKPLIGLVICVAPLFSQSSMLASASTAFRQLLLVICVAPLLKQSNMLASASTAFSVEFYLYPTVGTILIHSIKPELTE